MLGNALGFHFGVRQKVEAWATADAPPFAAKVAGAIAIPGWIGVVVAARLIAFV